MNSVDSVQSQMWSSDGCTRTQSVVQAIKTAARTSSGFDYLLRTAKIESGLNPDAKSGTSSATGLFQFTEQTWLQMVKAHGTEYGLGNYAAQIQTSGTGTAHVDNAASRQAILELRKDPQVSTQLAGALNKTNAELLQKNVGGNIGPTELYLAHFLGAGGASTLLKAMRANPNLAAADIVPSAAKSNSSIFYGADGQPNSVGQIYRHFEAKLDQAGDLGMTISTPHHPSAELAHSVPQALVTPTSPTFASVVLDQTNMAMMAASLMLDEETESALSVLA